MFHSQWRLLLISSYFCLQSATDLEKKKPTNLCLTEHLHKVYQSYKGPLITVYIHSLLLFSQSAFCLFIAILFFHYLESGISSATNKCLIFGICSSGRSCCRLKRVCPSPSLTILLLCGVGSLPVDTAVDEGLGNWLFSWLCAKIAFWMPLSSDSLEQPGSTHTVRKGRVYFAGDSTPS